MVVYLDVLFAVNALMDGATLLAAAALGGVRAGRIRLLLAAALGGGYAVLAAVVPIFAVLPLRVLTGIGLCGVAFSGKPAFDGCARCILWWRHLSQGWRRRWAQQPGGGCCLVRDIIFPYRFACCCLLPPPDMRSAGFCCAEMHCTARCVVRSSG